MMKKTLVSLLTLLAALTLLFTFTACSDPQAPTDEPSAPETPEEQPKDEPPSDDPADDPVDDPAFGAQYSRSGYPESLGPLAITVIRTRWELDTYLDTFPYPDASYNNAPTLTQLCERYDEDYFASRDLIIVFLMEGSGSIRHQINAVYRDGATGIWTIDIERLIPEEGTDDEAWWTIFIEPPKNMHVQEGDTFRIGEHTLSPVPHDTFGYDWGNVQYVRTNGRAPDTEFPHSLVIRSRQELLEYYEQNKAYYNMDSSRDESPAFRDAIDRYDEAYFAKRELLVVVLQENSGSIRHHVNFMRERFTETEGWWEVSITSFSSMYETEDMAQWHILIEMPEGLHTAPDEKITLLFTQR